MAQEFEIKFTSINKNETRENLKNLGFSCIIPEFVMLRKTFHSISAQKDEWFRLRKEANKITMTYKCIHSREIDGIEEHEIVIDDITSATEILLKTWLINTSTQENKREIWNDWIIEVCIDTWPGLSPYIEIEGKDPDLVKAYVEKLWYNFNDWLYWGSEVVYEKELWIPIDMLIKLPKITFDNPPKLC